MIKYNKGVLVDSQWTPTKLPQSLDGGLPVQSLKSHESPWDSHGSPLGVHWESTGSPRAVLL